MTYSYRYKKGGDELKTILLEDSQVQEFDQLAIKINDFFELKCFPGFFKQKEDCAFYRYYRIRKDDENCFIYLIKDKSKGDKIVFPLYFKR